MKFIITLLLCFSTYASQATEWDNILILGDSLSAGYGINVSESWPVLLQESLKKSQLNIKIHNASISGQTTAEGVSQIDPLLKLTQPKLVILELGANDGLRGLSVTDMQKNLQTIITRSQLAGANVLLIGIRTPSNYGRRYGQMFSQSFYKLANKNGITLVPFMLEPLSRLITQANKPDYIQKDGLHPTAKSQPILLNFLMPYIKKSI
jgi:acyl-CoA thioesterase-1